MAQVKAKFRCISITDEKFHPTTPATRRVKFMAAYGTQGENASFSKTTPSGTLEMVIDEETPAHDYFVPQKEYYLTFEEAPSNS